MRDSGFLRDSYDRLLRAFIAGPMLTEIRAPSSGFTSLYCALKRYIATPDSSRTLHRNILTLSMDMITAKPDEVPFVLQHFPNLKSLTITCEFNATALILSEEAVEGVVPMLECLTAPYNVVRVFVKNRPLHHVGVVANQEAPMTMEMIEGIGCSLPLRSFVVGRMTWQDDAVSRIAALFPALERLELQTDEPTYQVCLDSIFLSCLN